MYPSLRLKKHEDRRLRTGHAWVYSNEVDVKQTPLADFEPGDVVQIQDARGKTLGMAYVNPATLICARLYSRRLNQPLDQAFFIKRLRQALALRELVFSRPFYRLVYGESDGLPGLVVDRFDSVLVVQITTAGMEQIRDSIVDALETVLQPAVILLRNDSPARELEGLASYTETVLGHLPERVDLEENGTRFQAPLAGGQKTGWYYDHRLNRQRLQAYVKNRQVLDVFSYIGAWGVQALQAGANRVTCVDGSETFLRIAQDNAALNGHADALTTLTGDAFEILKELREQGEHYDVVVLDPPAFIKRRKDIKKGSVAYQRINQLAMQLLHPGGLLVSASCSWHFRRSELLESMRKAAAISGQSLQIMEQGHQGPDHPVHPAMRETDYLKAYFARVGR
ncbi:MAG: class I SAM-dependent rRNA methyltransferase [Thiohalomonadales bacterium]|nr:class I SAM-dependent rRNA methyltransferase [Thiohalomonadales bacterium]